MDDAPTRRIRLLTVGGGTIELSKEAARLSITLADIYLSLEPTDDTPPYDGLTRTNSGATEEVLKRVSFSKLCERLAGDKKAADDAKKARERADKNPEDKESRKLASDAEDEARKRKKQTIKEAKLDIHGLEASDKLALLRVACYLNIQPLIGLVIPAVKLVFNLPAERIRDALGHAPIPAELQDACANEPLFAGVGWPLPEGLADPPDGPPAMQRTVSEIALAHDILEGDETFKLEVLNKLDAACLRTLKRVSKQGLLWAREVLGDPASPWRQSGGIFQEKVDSERTVLTEADISKLLQRYADQQACTLVLQKLEELDPAVELPAHVESLKTLAASEKAGADAAAKLLDSMDMSLQHGFNATEHNIAGFKLLNVLLQRSIRTDSALLERTLLERMLTFEEENLAIMLNDNKVFVAMVVQSSLPIAPATPSGGPIDHHNSSLMTQVLDKAGAKDLLQRQVNQQARRELLSHQSNAVVDKALQMLAGAPDAVVPHLGGLLARDCVGSDELKIQALSIASEASAESLQAHVSALDKIIATCAPAPGAAVTFTFGLAPAASPCGGKGGKACGSHSLLIAALKVATKLDTTSAWSSNTIQIVVDELLKNDSSSQTHCVAFVTQHAALITSQHAVALSSHRGLLQREGSSGNQQTLLDQKESLIKILCKVPPASLGSEAIANIFRWLKWTPQVTIGKQAIEHLNLADEVLLRPHSSALITVRESARAPALKEAVYPLVAKLKRDSLTFDDDEEEELTEEEPFDLFD